MQEFTLRKRNIRGLPEFIRTLSEDQVNIFFPDYFDLEENERYEVPQFEKDNIRTIEKAKEIASERGIEVISNSRNYDCTLPDGFESNISASLVYENEYGGSPHISVIIPTKNGKEHLQKTLLALANQDIEHDYEIIIIEETSSGDTSNVIKSLAMERKIKYVYWDKKKNPDYGIPLSQLGPLRNLGARYSSGEILVFLDAGIVPKPSFLEGHVSSCDENSVVTGPCIQQKGESDERETYFSICGDDIDSLSIRWALLYAGNLSVHRKNFLNTGGFDKDFVFTRKEEEEFGFRLYKQGLHFRLNRKALGTRLQHEPQYINETLETITNLYQERIFYKKHLDSSIFHSLSHSPSPHLIKVGTKCNNNCRICNRLEKKSYREKDTKEIKKELRWAKRNNLDVMIGGGEPVIREDLLEILKYQRSSGLRGQLVSNGRIFADAYNIEKLVDAGLQQVLIYFFAYDSKKFDKITNVAGSYKQTLKGIRNLVENNIPVSLNVVLDSENYNEYTKIIELNDRLGVKTFHLSILTDDLSNYQLRYIAKTTRELLKQNYDIRWRERFINCFNAESRFLNEIDKIKNCAKCEIRKICPLDKKNSFSMPNYVKEKYVPYVPNIIVTPGYKIGLGAKEKKERYLEYLKNMSSFGSINMPPLEVEIELTFKCNLKCKMCDKWKLYQLSSEHKRHLKELFVHEEASRDDSFEKWKRFYVDRNEVLDFHQLKSLVDELARMGVRSVVLTGGEPTVHPEFNKIISYINHIGLKGSILTNAVSIDEERAQLLIEGDWKIRASIEGSSKDTNDSIMLGADFEKIRYNLRTLKEYQETLNKGEIKIHSVIQKENIDDIDNMVDFFEREQFDYDFALPNGAVKEVFDTQSLQKLKSNLSKYRKKSRYKNAFPFIEDVYEDDKKDAIIGMNPQKKHFEKEQVPCFYLANSCVINPYGDVFPCGSVMNPSNRMGNITRESFSMIWNSDSFNRFRSNTLPVDTNTIPNCQECDMFAEFKQIYREIGSELGSQKNCGLTTLASGPEELEIEITNFCNLRCIHCDFWQICTLNKKPGHINHKMHGNPVSEEIFHKGSTLQEDEKQKWIQAYSNREEILNFSNLKNLLENPQMKNLKNIIITGGEPTLHKDLKRIISLVNSANIKGELLTNGAYIDAPLANELMKANWRVSLSLDGSCKSTNDKIRGEGSYEKVMYALRVLKESSNMFQKGKINLHFVLQDPNVNELPHFLKLARDNNVFGSVDLATGHKRAFINERGYHQLIKILKRLENINGIEKHIPFIKKALNGEMKKEDIIEGVPYKSLIKAKKCNVGHKRCVVNAFGDVYPCCNIKNPSNCMGNILENSFDAIWKSKRYERFRDYTNRGNLDFISCGECQEGLEK